MGKIRTFIGIEIPAEIRTKIAEFQTDLKALGGRIAWVKPERIHLTLKFLGATDELLVEKIISQLEEVAFPRSPFRVKVGGVGAFPNFKKPRVIWVGVDEGIDILREVASDIDQRMSGFGFEKEKRQFSAHLTVGRVKDDRNIGSVIERLQQIQDFKAGEFIVSEMSFIKSQLTNEGPIYTTLKKIKFGG